MEMREKAQNRTWNLGRHAGRATPVVCLRMMFVGVAASVISLGASAQSAKPTPPAKRPSATPQATGAAKPPSVQRDTASKAVAPAALVAPAVPIASISGTVYDSVHASPLRGASVQVEGTNRMGITSNEGRYRIDSIPPGIHQVHVSHPFLDSVGVKVLVTNAFELAENESKILDLAVPSSATLVAVSCPDAQRRLGPSAIIGRLLDADTDSPVEGVRVSFAWSELSIAAGLRKVPRLRENKTQPDGVFRICGLPDQVEGTLQAENKGITTSEVRLTFEGQPLIVQGLRIGNTQTVARAATDSSQRQVRDTTKNAPGGQRFSAVNYQSGQAVLKGRVVGASGQPVAGARVDVEGTHAITLTKDNGEFTLTDLPSGTQTVVARQIGFDPVYKPVDLSTRASADVTITMSKPANIQTLATVTVTAQADQGLDKIGYTERKKMGLGYFISGDDIMKRGPNSLTDVFRSVPSLRVSPGGAYGTDYIVEDARGTGIGSACVRYVIDGAPYEAIYPGDVDRMIPPWEVGAIEVYHGSQTPVQFSGAGESGCATVVIWSKRQLENASRRKR
jgi:carboxypeptidase family protein/TonB-dependent receptor-like protein